MDGPEMSGAPPLRFPDTMEFARVAPCHAEIPPPPPTLSAKFNVIVEWVMVRFGAPTVLARPRGGTMATPPPEAAVFPEIVEFSMVVGKEPRSSEANPPPKPKLAALPEIVEPRMRTAPPKLHRPPP